jgi:hypothetical protein
MSTFKPTLFPRIILLPKVLKSRRNTGFNVPEIDTNNSVEPWDKQRIVPVTILTAKLVSMHGAQYIEIAYQEKGDGNGKIFREKFPAFAAPDYVGTLTPLSERLQDLKQALALQNIPDTCKLIGCELKLRLNEVSCLSDLTCHEEIITEYLPIDETTC